MKLIEFEDLTGISGFTFPTKQEASSIGNDAVTRRACRRNPHEHTFINEGGDTISLDCAECAVIGKLFSLPWIVDRGVCRTCTLFGEPDITRNPYLHHALLGQCLTRTRNLPDSPVFPIDPGDIRAALGLLKVHYDRAVALRLLNTLVAYKSVTPEQAADLAAEFDLLHIALKSKG